MAAILENLTKPNCNAMVTILLFDGGYNIEREIFIGLIKIAKSEVDVFS